MHEKDVTCTVLVHMQAKERSKNITIVQISSCQNMQSFPKFADCLCTCVLCSVQCLKFVNVLFAVPHIPSYTIVHAYIQCMYGVLSKKNFFKF